MFYFNNPKSKFLSAWCKVILASILFMQFLGYQHRIAHSFTNSSPLLSISQFNTLNNSYEGSDFSTHQENKHQCASWDHAVLGYGFSSLLFQIELLSLSFGINRSSYQSNCFSKTFSYHSRAPPTSN
jgi:hypothetical protein